MAITKIVDDMRTTVALDATKLSGTVPTGSLGSVDTSILEYNIAMLAFKHASQSQITKFAMVDQMIDEYQDATGIDDGPSNNQLAAGTTTAKYYGGGASVVPTTSSVGSVASAGTVNGDYTYYKWLSGSTGTFTTNVAQNYEILVVAGGGGGGGSDYAGGGGAGGYRTNSSFAVAATTITGITVGAAGAGGTTGASGVQGGNSVFSTIISAGGGYGVPQGGTPSAGGSGGGSANQSAVAGGAGNAPSLIAHTAGTIIGDFTSAEANAFNNVSNTRAASAQRTSSVHSYIGKDLGAGNAEVILGASWESPSDGDSVGAASSLTVYLYASNSAPSSYNNGTLLGTIGTEANATTGVVTSNLTFVNTTAYRYVWIHAQINGGAATTYCAEVRFYSGVTPPQGYAGGRGTVGYTAGTGGGGGGSSAVGVTPSGGNVLGHGGAGTANDIIETGANVIYAAGGGGGANAAGSGGGLGGSSGVGGRGGGTDGSPEAGAVNTGSGGGGADRAAQGGTTGGAGAAGIVVIRRLTSITTVGGDLILQSVAATNAPTGTAPTTGDLVVLIDDGGSGTTVEDVNVKGYISVNGSFSTLNTDHKQAEFTDEGSWGTAKQRILVSRNVNLVGLTTGSSPFQMKYKLTTHSQNAGTMETRIHATSLAWA
jgi:hypothetical protein